MINAKQIKIPFAGFYQSIHEAIIDNCIESNNIEDFSLTDEAMKTYCSDYAVRLSGLIERATDKIFDIEVEFVKSPPEYNFHTDEIFVAVPKVQLQQVFDWMIENHHQALKDMVFEKLSPRSGFAPYLSNDLAVWGNVLEWNASQVALMLDCLLIEENGDDWETVLTDEIEANGIVEDIVLN
jgi:hypothetical protein